MGIFVFQGEFRVSVKAETEEEAKKRWQEVMDKAGKELNPDVETEFQDETVQAIDKPYHSW